MLKIINDLKPFFEDCYRRISVREYAKIMHISPPTASKTLSYYAAERILLRTAYRNYILFYANKESRVFVGLSRIYWSGRLSGLVEFIERKLANPTMVLFGSLSKAEVKPDSDVDLVVFAAKMNLDLAVFEKKMKRKIQLFWFDLFKNIKSNELSGNIMNGYVLAGRLRF